MNPSHNLLLCSEKQAHLSRVDICVTLTNTFSPSRKLNRKASGNENAAWVHSLSRDIRGMVVMSKVSNVLKLMLSLTLWRWTCQTERTGCSCQLTRALSPWRVLVPDSQFLSPCRQPPSGWHLLSLDLLILPRKLQPDSAAFLALAWKTFYLSGALHRPLVFGLDCYHLIYWFSDLALEAAGKSEKYLCLVPSPKNSNLVNTGCNPGIVYFAFFNF